MAPPILTLRNIELTFGGTPLMTGIDFQLGKGDRIGLVGRNGSGKSTLLRIIAGTVIPDKGERFMQPGLRVAYLAQEPDLGGYPTLLSYAESGFDGGEDPYRARFLLNELGLTGDELPTTVSGGESRRAAIARALAPEPDVLLLDEPTNHLDLPAIEWLEHELAASRAAIVLISHDRRFLENLTRSTTWIDRGRTRTLNKGFAAFEAWRDDILGREEVERHKLDRRIAREQHWMHGGVTARRKRNVRRVDELAEMRRERRDARRQIGNVAMAASEAQASGRLVVEARGISKAFGDNVVVTDFSTRIARGDRVGLVGANGAGKTTLLKMLIGELVSDSGSVRLGSNLEVVTLDQNREALNPDDTLAQTLTGGRGDTVTINGRARHVASYMKDFLFLPEQAGSPLRVLSGGERARVLLARALAKPSNVLVLDEPTNDLDLETLDLLQELVSDYAGTVLLVSHDRDFLDRTVTSIIMADGDGRWIEYAGGYSDMLAQRGAGVEARRSHVSVQEGAGQAVPSKASGQAEPPKKQPRKLSFKDQHALARLPADIDALTAEIQELEQELSDPRLFATAPDRYAQVSGRLSVAQERLQEAEELWLELEMKREELES
ncbi:MAG: ABC-F family ATP-binding cassette domain-containing protein [Hyphomicrobiaceae bacterium]